MDEDEDMKDVSPETANGRF
jgi:hypothetical protein